MSFKIPTKDLFDSHDVWHGTVTYSDNPLTKYFSFSNTTASQPLYSAGNKQIGTYQIADNGKITLNFDKDDAAYGTEITGSITLWGDLLTSKFTKDTTASVTFNDEVTLPFSFKDSRPLEVKKTGSFTSADPVKGSNGIVAYWLKFHYTVKVTAPKGTDGKKFILDDHVTHWVKNGSVNSNTHCESPNPKHFDENGQESKEITLHLSKFGADGISAEFGALKPGESYELSYDVCEWIPAEEYENMTYPGNYYEENQAEAYPESDYDQRTETTCNTRYFPPMKNHPIDLQKTGNGTYHLDKNNRGNSYITWDFTLTVGVKNFISASDGKIYLNDYYEPSNHNIKPGSNPDVKSIELRDSRGKVKWTCPNVNEYIKPVYSWTYNPEKHGYQLFGTGSYLPASYIWGPPSMSGGPSFPIYVSRDDQYVIHYTLTDSRPLGDDEILQLRNHAEATVNGITVKADSTPEVKTETDFPSPYKFGDYADKDRKALRWTIQFNQDKNKTQKNLEGCTVRDSKTTGEKDDPTGKCTVKAYPENVFDTSASDGVKTYSDIALPLKFESKDGKSGFTDSNGKWYEIPSYKGMLCISYDQPVEYKDNLNKFENTAYIVNGDGKQKSYKAEFTYHQPDAAAISKTVDKNVHYSTDPDIKDGKITNHWTITLHNLKKSERYSVEDAFDSTNYGNVSRANLSWADEDEQWMTPSQVEAVKITAYDKDGKQTEIPLKFPRDWYDSYQGTVCRMMGHYTHGYWNGDKFTDTYPGTYMGYNYFPSDGNYVVWGLDFNLQLDQDLDTVVIKYDTTTSVKNMNPDSRRVMSNTANLIVNNNNGTKAYASSVYYNLPSGKKDLLTKYNLTDDGKKDAGTLKKKFSKDGMLYYSAVVNASKNADGDLVFEDQLPEGTQLVTDQKWNTGDWISYNPENTDYCSNGIAAKYLTLDRVSNGSSNPDYNTESNYYNGYGLFERKAEVTYNSSTNKLTVNIPESAYKSGNSPEQAGIVLYYAVKIKNPDAFMKGQASRTLTNTAIVKDSKDSARSSVNTDLDLPQIEKSDGVYDRDAEKLTYSLNINPQGLKLSDKENEKITIQDTLTWPYNYNNNAPVKSITADPDSIHLYKLIDGKKVETENYSLSTQNDVNARTSAMTLTVPDGQAYVLEYGYHVALSNNHHPTNFEVTNTASIKGRAEAAASDQKVTRIYSVGSKADASTKYTALTLQKVDEKTGKPLAGAEFVLEQYTGRSEDAWKVIPGDGDDNRYITDKNGTVQLGDKHPVDGKDIRSLRYNYLYRIKEVKAPKGYEIKNADYQYIYLRNDAISSTCKPDSFDPEKSDQMSVIDGITTVEDPATPETPTPIPTPSPIYHHVTVQKTWTLDDGKTRPDSIQVQLMKDGVAYGSPVTLNDANRWTFTWSNLENDGSKWTVNEVLVPQGFKSTQQTTVEGDDLKVVINNDDQPDKPNEPDNPEKPDKPDKPTNPEKPNTPAKPNTSGRTNTPYTPKIPGRINSTTPSNTPAAHTSAQKHSSSVPSTSAPRTSDSTRLGTVLIVFGGAAAALAAVLALKRKENE